MAHPFLNLLPVPVNLGARLAMLVIFIALMGVVLAMLALLEVTSLVPVDTEKTFAGVVFVLSGVGLASAALLWGLIKKEVLTPLERISRTLTEEEKGSSGLGTVAEKVVELREAVHRTQTELDESHEALRQIERLAMVGKLAAGVAHSVRNPLTAVKLRLFSLQRSLALTVQQREDFTVITEAMRHVDTVVSNFLEFSRRPHLHVQQVDVSSIMDTTLHLFENKLSALPVSTTLKRNKTLPAIQADPDQLREVLLNILQNACEAMDYSGNLTLSESLQEHDNIQYVCIAIHDSGPGIPKDQLERIFVPFFSTKEQGTGLGLPIAKNIIEEHGGDILVESSAKHGTTFSILLPVTGQHKDVLG